MGRRRSRRQPHTAKPYAARRASALTALFVRTAAFWRSVKGGGEIESRRVCAKKKGSSPEGACQPLRGFLAPSSAGAAAFSIPIFPETSAETPRLSHSCKSAACKMAHLAVLTPPTRRAAPPLKGRGGMGRRLRRRPHTAKPYAARRATSRVCCANRPRACSWG